ncbi:MAG: CBS domain-containing protein [Sedimenticola sp.]|uniref:CBS domain-containing protein n=1 Tax=Sedimenticola thiotaurini TaxID=1543721 RepID=A0A558D6Z9_9GAMM|nr:CBS domain-containing protein [Sedimenticola sp.]TVT56787.1 MAG: CBS domain-containing protein [Sedimenticola thiotaurini]MCW8882227.1 CBS domain-containing protein [Sedimenticola sp.]MCW8921506.1 CBS domain-containing protein [Sedimenticola sp.]MCW8945837.1 CBS domain-containing protein [Sedimenticola sp.]
MTKQEIIRVRDVMKPDVDTVDGMDTVEAALQKMDHVETKTLIVDKRDDNDAYGIVMFSDIARKVLAKDRPPGRVNIYEVMTKPVISVEPDMDIRYCARLFDRLHLSRAPVISNGKILGVVSFSDMIIKGVRKP